MELPVKENFVDLYIDKKTEFSIKYFIIKQFIKYFYSCIVLKMI